MVDGWFVAMVTLKAQTAQYPAVAHRPRFVPRAAFCIMF